MNILLTGGSGFIGRNIIEQLGSKYNIIAPTHKELELTSQEQVDNFFKNNKIDAVIHGAVRPGHRNAKDDSGQLLINTKMFFNLVRHAHKLKKLVYIGSALVYDKDNYIPRMPESYFNTHIPSDEGGMSKYIISKSIRDNHPDNMSNVVELVCFSIFGKYEDYSVRFISNLICKAVLDLPLTMYKDKMFSFTYINDLVKILDFCIRDDYTTCSYNVCADKAISLRSIADIILKVSNKQLPIIVKEEGMGAEYSGDNSLLRSHHDSFKAMDITKAIEELYQWYSNNMHLIDKAEVTKYG